MEGIFPSEGPSYVGYLSRLLVPVDTCAANRQESCRGVRRGLVQAPGPGPQLRPRLRGQGGQGPGARAGRGVDLGQVTLGGGAVAPDRSEVPLIPGYTGQAEGKQTNRAVPSPIAAA